MNSSLGMTLRYAQIKTLSNKKAGGVLEILQSNSKITESSLKSKIRLICDFEKKFYGQTNRPTYWAN